MSCREKVCIPLKGIEGSNPSLFAFARRSFSKGGLVMPEESSDSLIFIYANQSCPSG